MGPVEINQIIVTSKFAQENIDYDIGKYHFWSWIYGAYTKME